MSNRSWTMSSRDVKETLNCVSFSVSVYQKIDFAFPFPFTFPRNEGNDGKEGNAISFTFPSSKNVLG